MKSADSWWETSGERQAEFHRAILDKQVVFAIGPSGTGKTLIATYTALDLVYDRRSEIERIIVSRPLVTVGEKMGTLPGDVLEKISPYLAPVMDLIRDHPNHQQLLAESAREDSRLTGKAVSMMRGSTVRDALWLLDEAQNLTRHEFEMCLTRMGHNSKLVINGDPDQMDIKDSGLMHAIKLMEPDPDVAVVRFTVDDVKRSDFVGRVIRAYSADRASKVKAKE